MTTYSFREKRIKELRAELENLEALIQMRTQRILADQLRTDAERDELEIVKTLLRALGEEV